MFRNLHSCYISSEHGHNVRNDSCINLEVSISEVTSRLEEIRVDSHVPLR